MDAAPQSTAARLFDAMADEYDVLEPWYEHLYAELHAILTTHLAPQPRERGPAAARPARSVARKASTRSASTRAAPPPARARFQTERADRAADGRDSPPATGARLRALDAGCGHGAQTKLLRALGYETHGVDIAPRLLALARGRVPDAALVRADLVALPYGDATFDVVSCAGSTLSFVDDADAALRELARVLRPGGRLLLECEHKWSLDLGWTLASALTGDAIGYGVSLSTLARALRAPLHASIALPYPDYGTMTLFSGRDLRRRLAAVGLSWDRAWGIHAVTNVIPSTILHRPRVPWPLARLYRALRRVDAALRATAPARALGNSLVVLAIRA